MPREHYKSVSVKRSIYDRVMVMAEQFRSVRSFAEAVDVVTPVTCLDGYIDRGHIVVELYIERVTVNDVLAIKIGEHPLTMANLDRIICEILGIDKPELRLVLLLLALYRAVDSETLHLTTMSFEVKRKQRFLVDTGATSTVINVNLLPREIKDHALWSIDRKPTLTAKDVIYLPRGTATLKVNDKTVKVPVLFLRSSSSAYHILGVDAIRGLLGPRVLLDFQHGKVCVYKD